MNKVGPIKGSSGQTHQPLACAIVRSGSSLVEALESCVNQARAPPQLARIMSKGGPG